MKKSRRPAKGYFWRARLLEKINQARIIFQTVRACCENRSLYFQGVRYFDPWDLREAVVDSGRKFSELEIDRDDDDGIFIVLCE
jgi:hypothetical protein